MNFTLFELAGELLAALRRIYEINETDMHLYSPKIDEVAEAAIAKAESAGIVARPTEQA